MGKIAELKGLVMITNPDYTKRFQEAFLLGKKKMETSACRRDSELKDLAKIKLRF